MRYVATSLLLACFTLSTSLLHAATAVPASAEPGNQPTAIAPVEVLTEAQKAFGVLEETPNQRRIRLGQPIEASFPAPDYGELLETPNQMRARLQTQAGAQTAQLQ